MPTTNRTSTASMELYLRSKRAQDALKADVKDAKAVPVAELAIGIGAVAVAAVRVEVQAAVREGTVVATPVAAVVEEDAKSD
jgi:hypothetical protein